MNVFRTLNRFGAVALTALAISFSAPAGTPAVQSVLYRFTDCSKPSPIIQASDGNFYGTCSGTDVGNNGYVFEVPIYGGGRTMLYAFTGGADGGVPISSLIEGNDGNLYGTNTVGGASGYGVIFRLPLAAPFVRGQLPPIVHATVLHSFTYANGVKPGALIQTHEGDLYGTAANGGTYGLGTIFELSSAGTFSVLHSFSPLLSIDQVADGAYPQAPLVQASDSYFYGVTPSNRVTTAPGTVFRLFNVPASPSGIRPTGLPPNGLTNIATFPRPNANDPNNAGYFFPLFGMTEAGNKVLYGLTEDGYAANQSDGDEGGEGSVYEVTMGGASGIYTVAPSLLPRVYTGFNESLSSPNPSAGGITCQPPYGTGAGPNSGLTLGGGGNLYGTTQEDGPAATCGGAPPDGTVFRYNPLTGAVDAISSFATGNSEPLGAPIAGADGALYGSAASELYKVTITPALPAPIVLTTSAATIKYGQSATLQWSVGHAFSMTAQNCWAHGAWSGDRLLTGTMSVTPTGYGVFQYALTCGGVESAVVSVSVTP